MNNRGTAYILLFFASVPLMAGCLGRNMPVLPETQRQAEAALTRGIRAQQNGDFAQSEQYLEQSLALSSSIEDTHASTLALINLSRLKRLRGEPEKAATYIDRALKVANSKSPLTTEMAYEKSLVELARGSAATALPWAEKACREEKGAVIGSRLNLAARILLLLGRVNDAEEMAAKGLNESRTARDDEETANSLRVLGMVAREQLRLGDSERLLLEALQIDKVIGKSGKVSTDLEELARTAEKGYQWKRAAEYLDRAGDVHRAGGRSQQAEALSGHSTELKRKSGERQPPPLNMIEPTHVP